MAEHDTFYHSPRAGKAAGLGREDNDLLLSANTTPLQAKNARTKKPSGPASPDRQPTPAAAPKRAEAPAGAFDPEAGSYAFNYSLELLQAEVHDAQPAAGAAADAQDLSMFLWPGALRERVDAPGTLYNKALVLARAGRAADAARDCRRSLALLAAAGQADTGRAELRATLLHKLSASAREAPRPRPAAAAPDDPFNLRLEEREEEARAAGGAGLSVFTWPGALRERVDSSGLLFNKALQLEACGDYAAALVECARSRAWLGVPAPGGGAGGAGGEGERGRERDRMAERLRERMWGAA